ncbi:helix-turn-helix transcriptional regulator [Plantactinospora sp. B6F1]|uniref:helix-turn-helix domain-containing protein n=1 Tax=Plantactinospora sp. B6F1 TaxID=3158971 RepID=UPI0032D950AE
MRPTGRGHTPHDDRCAVQPAVPSRVLFLLPIAPESPCLASMLDRATEAPEDRRRSWMGQRKYPRERQVTIIVNDRQDLPSRLRQLRVGRKLSQEKVAAALTVSKSLIQQFESGKLTPQDDTAQRLDEFFGTGDEIRKLAKLEREDRQPWLRSWFEQERRAMLIRTWEPLLIPGLLQ